MPNVATMSRKILFLTTTQGIFSETPGTRRRSESFLSNVSESDDREFMSRIIPQNLEARRACLVPAANRQPMEI